MHMDKEYQRKIKNKDCSIISMNCVGGVVSHELGLRFNSPTVNLWFTPKEFIKFLSQLEHYLYDCKIEMDEKNSEKYGYPVGKLEDIHVYFPRITSTEKISVGAERQRRYRAVKKLRAAPTEEHLWEVVLIYQKVRFKTYSGLPSPKIMSGEISAKEAAEERIWAEQTPQRCSGPRTLRTMCSMKIDFQI